MYRILVTGSNGQLGSEIRLLEKYYPAYVFFFTDVIMLDIRDKVAFEKFVTNNKINSIINCAAYTAVDKAESESELADKINHLAVKAMAEIAKKYACKFIHISTDYVFDGESYKPYVETDIPNPKSVYGKTKLDGELALQKAVVKNSIIIRTSWVYSNFGNNFVKTMLRLGKERETLKVIHDQVGTPTNAADLAKVILAVLPKINNSGTDIFHYSNEGVCSWFDFAKAIFEIKKQNCKIIPISTKMYPTTVKRPCFSLLSKNKIKETYKLDIPYWRSSLQNLLSKK